MWCELVCYVHSIIRPQVSMDLAPTLDFPMRASKRPLAPGWGRVSTPAASGALPSHPLLVFHEGGGSNTSAQASAVTIFAVSCSVVDASPPTTPGARSGYLWLPWWGPSLLTYGPGLPSHAITFSLAASSSTRGRPSQAKAYGADKREEEGPRCRRKHS